MVSFIRVDCKFLKVIALLYVYITVQEFGLKLGKTTKNLSICIKINPPKHCEVFSQLIGLPIKVEPPRKATWWKKI